MSDTPEEKDEEAVEEAPVEEKVFTGEEDLESRYDFEHGEPIDNVPFDQSGGMPWKAEIESPKEYFNTEILYRYDILEAKERQQLAGSYRVHVEGDKGGVWTILLGEDLEVKSDETTDEMEVTLVCEQADFLRLVNGSLNPQIAFVSEKIRAKGNLDKALSFQCLLCPIGD